MASLLRRSWPLLILLAGLGLAYAAGLHHYLTFEALGENRAALAALVAEQPVASALGFVGVYIAVVAFSVPVGALMTLASGFLFGPWLGAALAVVGASVGACLVFLAARHVLGAALAARAGPLLDKVRAGLEQDGFWYLLSMRLIPVVPFWLSNLAPALVGMRFRPFALATFLGIIPATTVFAGIGAGLGQVFASGGRPNLSVIFSPGVLLPLCGLAALSLLGAWWRGRQRGKHA